MPVPTRASWVKMRDAAGVPKGFGKLDMGPSFEKYIGVEQKGNYKERYAAAVALRKVCLSYYGELVNSKDKKIKAFAAVFESKIYKDLVKTEAAYKEMANPTLKLKTQLVRLLQSAATVKDKDTWSSWWSGPVRGVGTMRKFLQDALPKAEYNAFDTAYPVAITSQAFLTQGQDAKNMAGCVAQVLKHAAAVNNAAHQYGWW